MIFVDLNELELDDQLIANLDNACVELNACADLAARKNYIDNHADEWRKARPALERLRGEKCWYCEALSGAGFSLHIDHFRPKKKVKNRGEPERDGGYWWLSFKVENFRLSCQHCNSGQGKQNQFPLANGSFMATAPDHLIEDEVTLLLDPTRADDPIYLSYADDGHVYPNPRYGDPNQPEDSSAQPFDFQRARATIDVLNLRYIRKVRARRRLWNECRKLAKRGRQARRDMVSSQTIEARRSAERNFTNICEDIKNRVAPTAQFSAMTRYCFNEIAKEDPENEWLIDVLQRVV